MELILILIAVQVLVAVGIRAIYAPAQRDVVPPEEFWRNWK